MHCEGLLGWPKLYLPATGRPSSQLLKGLWFCHLHGYKEWEPTNDEAALESPAILGHETAHEHAMFIALQRNLHPATIMTLPVLIISFLHVLPRAPSLQCPTSPTHDDHGHAAAVPTDGCALPVAELGH